MKEPYHSNSYVDECNFGRFLFVLSGFWSMTMARSAVVVRARFQPCWTSPAVFTLLLFVNLTMGGVDIVARITWVLGRAMQYMGCGNLLYLTMESHRLFVLYEFTHINLICKFVFIQFPIYEFEHMNLYILICI